MKSAYGFTDHSGFRLGHRLGRGASGRDGGTHAHWQLDRDAGPCSPLAHHLLRPWRRAVVPVPQAASPAPCAPDRAGWGGLTDPARPPPAAAPTPGLRPPPPPRRRPRRRHRRCTAETPARAPAAPLLNRPLTGPRLPPRQNGSCVISSGGAGCRAPRRPGRSQEDQRDRPQAGKAVQQPWASTTTTRSPTGRPRKSPGSTTTSKVSRVA